MRATDRLDRKGRPMDRTERFYKIDQLLKSGTRSFAELKDALEVSRATLKRDLDFMRSRLHAPIEYDRDANGYRFGKPKAGPRYELPGLWFSPAELHALLTMQHLLENLQPGLLAPHIKPLQSRLAEIIGSGEHDEAEVARRVRVLHLASRELKHEHFGVVAQAVMKRRRLRIRHYNRMEDRRTEREISPQRLVHYRDNWYVDAYCHLREDLRSFSVDAIEEAALLDAKAKDVPKAELDAFLKSGYGIFSGRNVSWAKLRFSPKAARWVSTQTWHGKQRAGFEKDGSYILEVPYADDRELLMDVLKFGPDAEVLAPPALRERAAALLEEAARRYG
jgi:predicted DNA-binding transcriptional regulator YafY